MMSRTETKSITRYTFRAKAYSPSSVHGIIIVQWSRVIIGLYDSNQVRICSHAYISHTLGTFSSSWKVFLKLETYCLDLTLRGFFANPRNDIVTHNLFLYELYQHVCVTSICTSTSIAFLGVMVIDVSVWRAWACQTRCAVGGSSTGISFSSVYCSVTLNTKWFI